MKNCRAFLVLISAILLAPAHSGESDPAEAARREVKHLLTKARLEVMIEHFKQLNAELQKVELELEVAAAEATSSDGVPPGDQRLSLLGTRAQVLRRAIKEKEQAIEKLFVERAVAGGGKSEAAPKVGQWQGSAVGDSGIELVVWLSDEAGKFVVEEKGNRLAGTVTIHGEEWDFRVTEARGDSAEKYLGRSALGIWRLTDRGLAIVLNEPGKPQRPTKFEAEGDCKAFLLQRR